MSGNDRPASFETLVQIVAKLRAPEGCPWDRAQDHQSIRSYLLEECYEALEALDAGDSLKLKEELGDILLQILLHSEMASQEDEFTIGDVIAVLSEKLVRRHPHVFGDTQAHTPDQVTVNWEAIKQKERGPRKSVLDGVPKALPALAYSQSIHRRAAGAGFDWDHMGGVLDKLQEEVQELTQAQTKAQQEAEMGDILATLVNVGRKLDIDMESSLRKANERFRQRFAKMEELCRERDLSLVDMTEEGQEALWQEAKQILNDSKS